MEDYDSYPIGLIDTLTEAIDAAKRFMGHGRYAKPGHTELERWPTNHVGDPRSEVYRHPERKLGLVKCQLNISSGTIEPEYIPPKGFELVEQECKEYALLSKFSQEEGVR